MLSISHQRLAARFRHAAAAKAQAQFWADLDRRYSAYLANYKSPDFRHFCAISRQQCYRQKARPFRPSTYLTWLRAWSRQRAQSMDSCCGRELTIDSPTVRISANAGCPQASTQRNHK